MHIHVNKSGIRVLGVAESFVRSEQVSRLAGIVMRGDLRIDGLALARITVGGDDATSGVLSIFDRLDRSDINVILLNGNVISWFNIIDTDEVFRRTGKPLISLTYEESPGLEEYIREYFVEPEEKLQRYYALGRRIPVMVRTGYEVYVRTQGTSIEEAVSILNRFTLDGRTPEPIRVARMMARAALREDRSTPQNR